MGMLRATSRPANTGAVLTTSLHPADASSTTKTPSARTSDREASPLDRSSPASTIDPPAPAAPLAPPPPAAPLAPVVPAPPEAAPADPLAPVDTTDAPPAALIEPSGPSGVNSAPPQATTHDMRSAPRQGDRVIFFELAFNRAFGSVPRLFPSIRHPGPHVSAAGRRSRTPTPTRDPGGPASPS